MLRARLLVSFWSALAVIAAACWATAARAQGPLPQAPGDVPLSGFTYQGSLKHNGVPVNAVCALTFSLHDASAGGAQVGGAQALAAVTVTNGLFTVLLNGGGEFGASAFDGSYRWLQTQVQCPGDGAPMALTRQLLSAAPYALSAINNWSLSGNAAAGASSYLGTANVQTLTLKANGVTAMRYTPNAPVPNIIGGYAGNLLTGTLTGTVIAGGGAAGNEHAAGGNFAVIAGGRRNVISGSADFASIGGGTSNSAGAPAVVIGGGYSNKVLLPGAVAATIGGGESNQLSGHWGTIGGGYSHVVSGTGGTSAGGFANQVRADYGSTGGGFDNRVLPGGDYGAVAGGRANVVTDTYGAIGGGNQNLVAGSHGAIGGGWGNVITGGVETAFIGGGRSNEVRADYGAVAGGYFGINAGMSGAVGGGRFNEVWSTAATVAGGQNNVLSLTAAYGSIGGGIDNFANGIYSVIPGGYANSASGTAAFAAGYRAKANQSGAFVWADNLPYDFASGAFNQFAVRATGGVSLVTSVAGGVPDAGVYFPAGGGLQINSGGTVFRRVQAGEASAGASAFATKTVTVTFPAAFSAVPKVMATTTNDPNWDVSDTFVVTVRRVFADKFVLNVLRVDSAGAWSQDLRIEWLAWE